jgi:hypothetical protein
VSRCCDDRKRTTPSAAFLGSDARRNEKQYRGQS